ncbi:hypothetical protein BIW11_07046 [Tropilaelaps mercedesae]|uniref:Uncharacterized protein n=1 Tax=Tropilaelaps mercedesae TaxID=418985 RepID=A0A1V9XVI9_9ACAR|nr:hypothetical protein BIW11_07046 [Tropilaelaps mercedesae]
MHHQKVQDVFQYTQGPKSSVPTQSSDSINNTLSSAERKRRLASAASTSSGSVDGYKPQTSSVSVGVFSKVTGCRSPVRTSNNLSLSSHMPLDKVSNTLQEDVATFKAPILLCAEEARDHSVDEGFTPKKEDQISQMNTTCSSSCIKQSSQEAIFAKLMTAVAVGEAEGFSRESSTTSDTIPQSTPAILGIMHRTNLSSVSITACSAGIVGLVQTSSSKGGVSEGAFGQKPLNKSQEEDKTAGLPVFITNGKTTDGLVNEKANRDQSLATQICQSPQGKKQNYILKKIFQRCKQQSVQMKIILYKLSQQINN